MEENIMGKEKLLHLDGKWRLYIEVFADIKTWFSGHRRWCYHCRTMTNEKQEKIGLLSQSANQWTMEGWDKRFWESGHIHCVPVFNRHLWLWILRTRPRFFLLSFLLCGIIIFYFVFCFFFKWIIDVEILRILRIRTRFLCSGEAWPIGQELIYRWFMQQQPSKFIHDNNKR